MDWSDLIASLEKSGAFPGAPSSVEVRHTHISVVFLADDLVYKVKKPVDFGFLNFLTLEDRKKYCLAEVELNSRLAPGVYLGVVPIAMGRDGPVFEGDGEPLEWAVKMRRLPDDATLAARLARGELDGETFVKLGRAIADFHGRVATGPEIARHGEFSVIAHNSRENYQQAAGHVGVTLADGVWRHLQEANERELARLRPLMEARVARGMTKSRYQSIHNLSKE